jgi:hypothetical protein
VNDAVSAIVKAFDGIAVRARDESELQSAVSRVLAGAGIAFEEQVRLAPAERIDFMCGSVGLELKTKGGAAPLIRQLFRYAQHERISALVVVSTLRRLSGGVPAEIGGKQVFTIGVGAL